MDNQDSEGGSGCISCFCDPRRPFHRFLALILMCLIGFGSYFCYDNPGALQDNFKQDLGLTTTQFVALYSVYSWPNVILCFIGGFLIDRVFGIRLGTVIYMVILLIGALIFAIGGFTNTFWIMIVGRFLFGIGAESLAVAQNNYAVLWFKGKELNMVFGLQLSFARVGSTVNFIVMEPLYKWVTNYYTGSHRIGIVLFMAALTCLASLICGIVLGWMDWRAEKYRLQPVQSATEEKVSLGVIRHFNCAFWLISVICVAYYVAIFPFIALGKIFFERKFEFSPEAANIVNSIVYIISAVASPLMGFLIDKTGRNLVWVVTSILVTIGAHSILTFTFWNPYIGMVIMGLSYSMLASGLWPLVALVVPESQLGTAYGICQSVQNLGLAVITLIAGMIVDKGGYFMLEMFFLGCLFVALISAVCMWIIDSAQKGILNMSPENRERHVTQSLDSSNILNSDWTEDPSSIEASQEAASVSQSDRIRSRYLAKIGTHSDTEPLLH